MAQALVSTRFDYANAILSGAPKYNITKLQRLQNALARVETRPALSDDIATLAEETNDLLGAGEQYKPSR